MKDHGFRPSSGSTLCDTKRMLCSKQLSPPLELWNLSSAKLNKSAHANKAKIRFHPRLLQIIHAAIEFPAQMHICIQIIPGIGFFLVLQLSLLCGILYLQSTSTCVQIDHERNYTVIRRSFKVNSIPGVDTCIRRILIWQLRRMFYIWVNQTNIPSVDFLGISTVLNVVCIWRFRVDFSLSSAIFLRSGLRV